jgi:phenylalanyl-tRNA synthetase alpha chain
MLDKLNDIGDQARAALLKVSNAGDLEQWRVQYLGRKGEITELLRGLGSLSKEERPAAGAAANQLKNELETALIARQEELAASAGDGAVEALDVTLPGRPIAAGGLHPTTRLIREVSEIFRGLGFDVVGGPEVEWDYYNFEALNIPRGHPARDMWDTFWFSPPESEKAMLLRTHTSPMQVRIMEQQKPPIRVIVPGRCYRYEATDATHESVFYQFEGLAVDEGITMADLKGTLYAFAQRMFGQGRRVRFRCDFFPFVEPGVEVAIDCFVCNGEGCSLCRRSGWIEVLGAGMVHPWVLENVGIDSKKYTGFAFGAGVERLLMLKHQIDDIRLFYGNDLRFLRQFN